MAEDTLRLRKLRHKCRFILTTPLPTLFIGKPYNSALARICKEREIDIIPNFTPARIDRINQVIHGLDGRKISFDLANIAPVYKGSDIRIAPPDIASTNGWITCDKNKLTTYRYNNIHCIGDAADIPIPKTVSAAAKEAAVVCERFKKIIKGEEPDAIYNGETVSQTAVKHGKVMVIHFNYGGAETSPLESSLYWNVKVNMLRPLYFNLMLPGLM